MLESAPGSDGVLSIHLTAQGDENAIGFTAAFDPGHLIFTGASLGSGAGGAALYINTNQAASGRVGIALALPPGTTMSAGYREMLQLGIFASGGSGVYSVTFEELVVPREVSDASGNALPVSYSSGEVSISGPLLLTITRAGSAVRLAWPLWATNAMLQEASGSLPLVAGWTNLPVSPTISNNQYHVLLPLLATNKFYRLYRP
jgi:hypothetical protein